MIPLKCEPVIANIAIAPIDGSYAPVAPVHRGDGMQWVIMAHCVLGLYSKLNCTTDEKPP